MFKYFSHKVSVWKVILLVGDVCLLCLTMTAGLFLSPRINDPLAMFASNKAYFLLMGLMYLLVNYIADLYDYQKDYRRWWHIAQVFLAACIGTLANIVLFYFPLGKFVGRFLLIIQASSLCYPPYSLALYLFFARLARAFAKKIAHPWSWQQRHAHLTSLA